MRERATTRDAKLYEEDFDRWCGRQIELLRAGRLADLDVPHLIEEIDLMARRDRDAALSHWQVAVVHLLKLEHSPAREPRRLWRLSVRNARLRLTSMIGPTLRGHLAGMAPRAYELAREEALINMAADGVDPEDVPKSCPYDLDQVLDDGFWPRNRRGIED